MIKTINLNGSETRITELGGDNTEIFNNSSGIVYASKLPNITVGGDEVIAIPPGAIDGLYGTHGTIYLLGTGSVELRGVDHKITNVRGQSVTSGETGVLAGYVDEKCCETLANANAYSDNKAAGVVVGVKKYADDKDLEMLDSAKKHADSLKAELEGYIGYTDSDIYGLEADFENCVFKRLAGAVGKKAGADFDGVSAYGGRRRCNLSDDGKVLAYYGDKNFKADGSNGQVMVEQPKFYYRVVPLKTEKINGADGYHLRKARYYISDTPKAGFKIHPAFVCNGVEVDRIYLSAFEGNIYDTSAEAYLLNDEQIADFENDKLSSIAGAKPCSGVSQKLTRTNARKLANNRGEGWEQHTIKAISVTQILFVIEYARFNAQETIGMGIVNKSNAADGNHSEKTGLTLSLGDFSGTIKESDNIEYVSYRGEENPWGNIQNWVDGLSEDRDEGLKNGFWTVHVLSDSNTELSTDVFFSECCRAYISSFSYKEKFDWLFLPSETKGNDAVPVGDYVWNNGNGKRACNTSGYWNSLNAGGLFATAFNFMESSFNQYTGARLVYYPINQS